MLFYVLSFEQVHGADGKLNEYVSKSDGTTLKQATTKFYEKCGSVNADLSDNGHTYMSIKLMTGQGDCIKQDKLGSYIEQ